MPHRGEETRLLEPQNPAYIFDSSIARERKRRVKQFQCCICAIFLILFLIALTVTVAYSITNPLENDETISETSNNTTNATTLPILSTVILLTNSYPLKDRILNKSKIIDKTNFNKSIEFGNKALLQRDKIEENIPSLPLESPSYRHQRIMWTSNKGRHFGRQGYRNMEATKHLFTLENISNTSLRICLEEDLEIAPFCKNSSLSCNRYNKYRSYNGTCNNLNEPHTFGVAYLAFRRALPPDYSDNINDPRTSKSNVPLPSARTISIEVHRPYYRTDPKFTVMLAIWGQFLDHDMTATAISQKVNGTTISCCGFNISSPECFPVILDPDDPLAEENVTCMEFVRASPALTCCFGPREQMNQATSFIDGSVIYGVDEEKVLNLREMSQGRLKMFKSSDGRELLPISEDFNDGCNRKEQWKKGRYCFMTGDERANENLHITSMHLLWARNHNNIASNLSKINPHWDDEKLFQEARKIVGAQMQHITYTEFLPILLGDDIMNRFDLKSKKQGYSTGYNESIDPSVANNFAGAAFRFAHTLIPGLMKLLANDTSSPEFIQMHKILFDPFKLYVPGELDRILRGAVNTSVEASDSYFSEELVSHLFERNDSHFSRPILHKLDLVSLNIQRGRDQGIPGYIYWREHCGLSKPKNFQDLKPYIDPQPFYNIKSVYKHVEDIDLYTGGVSERPLDGGFLGPTFTCLILDQFIRTKIGDRFWYENPESFTKDQLQEIRKISLAGVICESSDNVEVVQRRVMERIEKGNENVHCEGIEKMDLEPWKENKFDRLKIPTQSLVVKVGT